MGQNSPAERVLLTAPHPPTGHPAAHFLRSAWTGWLAGAGVVAILGFACVDLLPWSTTLVPILLLAAHLAVRAASEWPRVGFPACVLGVSVWATAAGFFRAGIGWSREWQALEQAGTLPGSPGMSPLLGTVLAILLGGSVLGVLFLHWGTVWRTLSSVRLAVVTLAAVGTLSVIGTMVVQRFGAGSLPEKEKDFVEKFMKGQGAVPVNARFMVSPPAVELTATERERIRLLGEAFGPGKARQMELNLVKMHEQGQKAMAIEKHVEARRDPLLKLFHRLEALGFTNVFRTWWFNALLVLLFVQVIAVLLRRYPWGWAQTGWVMTHVGVLITLAGCTISDLLLRDGQLGLAPGEVSGRFQEFTRLDALGEPSETDLGYQVRMLGTDQSFYHELLVAFPSVKAGQDVLWTQEQLRPGRVIPVDDPETKASYEVRILEVHERALVGSGMVSAKETGKEGGAPVVRIRLTAPAHDHGDGHSADDGHDHGPSVLDEGYLFTDDFYTGRMPAGLVRYRRAATESERQGLLQGNAGEGMGRYGTLRVRIPGGGEPLVLPATPGAKLSRTAPEGTPWTVEVVRFEPSYTPEKRESGLDPDTLFPVQPVLEVRVTREPKEAGAGDGATGSMIVYGTPGLQAQWEGILKQMAAHGSADGGGHGTGAEKYGPALDCSFRYEFTPPVRCWIVEGPGGPRKLVLHRPGTGAEVHDFEEPGAEVPLGTGGLALGLVEAIPDALPELNVEPLPEETDEQYIRTCFRTLETGIPPPDTVSVAKVRVAERDGEGGERIREEWLVARKDRVVEGIDYHSTDGRMLLRLSETQSAMMFRSALEVLALNGKPILRDGEPFRTVVRVNHPLVYGGYAFYQNSFIPAAGGRPAASVFRVKYDRGIPTIYTGFAVLTLGVCLLLYVDPVLRRRRRRIMDTGTGAAPGTDRQGD